MDIQVCFFGKPQILINGEKIQIQQKKILALFLYILFNVNCTRDELSTMFWCDYSEEDAKRNLRNSIYKLKNIIGEDILTMVGNSYIQLNSNLKVKKDIDLFITEGSDDELLTLHGFSFLEQFYVNNCNEFENWVNSIRGIYEKMALERLSTGLKNSIHMKDFILVEEYTRKMLTVDVYNEEACRSLMELYSARGAYNDAFKIYSDLTLLLKNDLEVEPELETTELYKKIINLKQANHRYSGSCSYSIHLSTITEISTEFSLFKNGADYHNCILSGDVGMGKTKVIEDFFKDEEDIACVRIRFDITSASVSYYSVEKTIEVLSESCHIQLAHPNYNDRLALDIYFLKAMEQIADVLRKSRRKELVILENLESIDEVSMGLLFSYLFDKFYRNIFVVGEYSQNFQTNFRIIEKLTLMPRNRILAVIPPKLKEMINIMNTLGAASNDSNLDFSAIYSYTGGNLMFLQDVVQNIRDNKPDIFAVHLMSMKVVSELFSCLNPEEYKCMQLLSIFEHGTELEALSHISISGELGLLDAIDHLSHRQLVRESKMDNHLIVKIITPMIRDIILEQISNFRKNELHRIVAEYFEEKHRHSPNDYFYLFELKYHYSFTDNAFKHLYYAMLDLQYHLDYCDEFFPAIQSPLQAANSFYLNKNKAYSAFDHFRDDLEILETTLMPEQLQELQMLRNFLLGRTLNRDGKRDKGITYIRELVVMAEKLNRPDMLLKGYLETIYYWIKREDEPLMRQYIEKAKRIAHDSTYEYEYGILLRLEGLCDIRAHKYASAERLLLTSIELFNGLRLKSVGYMNVAAAYDYLALICRIKRRYTEAKEYLQIAIDLCLGKNMKKSLELFYEDYAYILFLEENYNEAKRFFHISSEIYDMFGTYWLRSIGESCMSIIALKENQKEEALEHFRRAEIFSKKEMTAEELDILESARQMLKLQRII